MIESFKVEPVDIDESKFNAIDYGIWTFPSLHVFVGSVASGKSTLLYNIVTKFFYPIFENRIILFSPTAMNDPLTLDLIENNHVFINFPEYTNETLERVLQVIKEDNDDQPEGSEGIERWLIVFDDMLNQLPKSNTKESKFFNKFISTYRHGAGIAQEGSISIAIFNQRFGDLINTIRSNASYYMFLGSHSEKHIKEYSEQLNGVFAGSDEKFIEYYNAAKVDKFDFLTLDFRKLRAYRNYDTLLYDRDTSSEIAQGDKDDVVEDDKADSS